MKKLEQLKHESRNAHVFMKPNLKEDSSTRWTNKNVYESLTIFDGTSLEKISYKEDLKCELIDNKLVMFGMTYAEGKSPRPTLSVIINTNNLDLSNYNRLSFYVNPKAVGYQNFYFHFGIKNNGVWTNDAPSLDPNKVNHVAWEIKDVERNNVEQIMITAFMMGCPPEAKPEIEVEISKVVAEKVDAEYDNGWDLENRIAYSHVGYFENQKKIALTSNLDVDKFELYDLENKKVFEGSAKKIENNLGCFLELDFTSYCQPGEYTLRVGSLETKPFVINNKAYDSSIWKSMNFLRLLRCGEDIPGVHSHCHLNCRCVHPNGSSVPVFGGWHDAGDVSQFEICTAEMAHAILDLALKVEQKDNDLYERLLEEARVGLNWLLRTRFGDGMRAMAVLYNVWRDNVLTPENKSTALNVAENGPFENFTAAAALAKGAILFKNIDPTYSDWCKRIAIEDFDFARVGYEQGIYTKRWGPNVDSQVAGHGALASCELYQLTNNDIYITYAKKYAQIVLSCQERVGLGKEKLRGFFYEDPKHEYILTYEHRGHEQSPVQGLTKLMEVAPNDDDYQSWLEGVKLYREYILNTINDTRPYRLLPGHLYVLDKLNMERFTVPPSYGTKPEALIKLRKQASTGRKIDDNAYMRIFPISIQRKGYHATLLSKTKAVSSIASVLNDEELKQIAFDQIEWMFGMNPFSSSTMYGEGYNYHPLYVAFSPQMVGALPVGIKTLGDNDEPYWPMATQAVYKEIWGHTTGKYLWVLADIWG